MSNPPVGPSRDDSLNGWKEIAQHLGKSIRTVQRWESEYGLPVRRIGASRGEVIWASRQELDQWRARGLPEAAELPPQPSEPNQSIRPASLWTPRRVVGGAAIVVALSASALLLMKLRPVAPHLQVVGTTMRPQGETLLVELSKATPNGTASRWTLLPSGATERLGAPVDLSVVGAVGWSLTTDCATESGTHKLWMVDDRSGRSSNHVDVVVLANQVCQKPLPDLVAQAVTVDRAMARPGESLEVTYVLWNLGTAVAAATTTRVRLGRESSRSRVADLSLGDHAAPSLPEKGNVVQRVTVRVPETVTPGVYYVWVVADNTSVTVEPSGFNNFARSAAIVIARR